MSPNPFRSDAQNSAADQPDPHRQATPAERGDKPRRKTRGESATVSVFGAGLVVEGEVRANGDVQIEGRVKGDLSVEGQVSVAAPGIVEGEVTAERVVVAGRVEGSIRASEGTRLVSGAKVSADIRSPNLELEQGATLDGRVDMSGRKNDRRDATGPESVKSEPAEGDTDPGKASKRGVA